MSEERPSKWREGEESRWRWRGEGEEEGGQVVGMAVEVGSGRLGVSVSGMMAVEAKVRTGSGGEVLVCCSGCAWTGGEVADSVW